MTKEKRVIQDKPVGTVKAEEDFSLLEYYVPGDWAKPIIDGTRLFVIGRTGGGKTALLRYLESRHDKKRVIKIEPDEFAIQALGASIAEFPSQEVPEVFLKCLWLHTLVVEILKRSYGDSWGKFWSLLVGPKKRAYDYLELTEEISFDNLTMTDRLLSTLSRYKLSITKDGTSSGGKNESKSANFFSSFKELQRIADELKIHTGEVPYLVLIDELDQFGENTPQSKRVLKALFEVIIEQHKKNRHVHFVVALRTDIFSQIDFRQRETIEDYKVYSIWTKAQLKEILTRRISTIHEVPSKEVWKRFFPEAIGKEETFDFLYERSFGRPRDLILFVNQCIKHASLRERVTILPTDIEDAEATYSRNRLQALIDEWKFVYPNLDFLIEKFSQAPEPLKDRLGEVLLDTFVEVEADEQNPKLPKWILSYANNQDLDFVSLAKVLLSIGFLVFSRKYRTYEMYTEEKSLPSKLSFDHLCVHPALRTALDIHS